MQHFKGKGAETIHIVRATQLGLLLMRFKVSASSTRPQRLWRNADTKKTEEDPPKSESS